MTHSATRADRELHEDVYALARGDFGTFVELAFPILHPGKKFVHAAYLDVLFALMEDCAAGREPRVIVNLPPGFMKSMWGTGAFMELTRFRCRRACAH